MRERRLLEDGATKAEADLLRAARSYRVPDHVHASTLAAVAEAASPASAVRRITPRKVAGILSCGFAIGILSLVAMRSMHTSQMADSTPSAPIVATAAPEALPPSPADSAFAEIPSLSVNALPSSAPSANPNTKSAPPRVVDEAEELAAELAGLDRAKRTLEAGDAAAAVRLLDAHRVRFREGRLVPEAMALRVQALIAAGQRDKAEKLGAEFLKSYPTSPLAARVRTMLATENGR
ncbi:hypothetical protein AKJ09_02538 [Labilithrix luteola]|uniref:Outer membrane lipoprotein BamD-like domain-containing protein n=1 Tax=Labilithrix luteola TaxID=1391654 RepID=A0A0K1PRX3_9BACT|nr:hypothetical protein [Labilithrix luteola]AKU95874.1 hypothetical protein AKJ09_02538 [Labilithrix luteola]